MAKILMFGNQKGGVGKSQCTVILAAALSSAPFNLRVTVADVDSQKSIVAARKFDLRTLDGSPAFDVVDCSAADLLRQARQLDAENDVLLIDAAGKLDADLPLKQQEISKILMIVDTLFIPFVAGNYNFESTLNYLKFVRQIQQIRQDSARPLNVYGFVNMYRQRSVRDRVLLDDLDTLKKKAGLQVMVTPLRHYALFADADTFGTLYDPQTFDTAQLNALAWINEIAKTAAIRPAGRGA